MSERLTLSDSPMLAPLAVAAATRDVPAPLIAVGGFDAETRRAVGRALIDAGYRMCDCGDAPGGGVDAWHCEKEAAAAILQMSLDSGAHCDIKTLTTTIRLAIPEGVPVVLCGSSGELAVRLAALRAGAARYLRSPLDPERLLVTLDEIIGHRSDRDRYRVLLVDDDKSMLCVHAAMLECAGVKVHALQDPMRLLEEVERVDPEVLVLDVNMPGASGPELAAVLRERECKRHMPILFLSGEVDGWRQPLALSLGSDDFLAKPVSPERLVAAVVARVRRARQIRATHRRLQGLVYEREREHQAIDQHAIVSIADNRGKILYANDRFCAISGYSRDELIGQDHRIVNSGQHPRAFFRELWRRISRGEVWQGEVCNRRKDGSVYWVASTITPFLDGEGRPYQYVSIRTDISEQVMAREALQTSQHELARRVWESEKRARESACLGAIVQVLLDESMTIDELVCGVMNLIPSGWMVPAETAACVHYGSTLFSPPGFCDGRWVLRAALPAQAGELNAISVHRSALNNPDFCSEPFLAQEQALLDAIAVQLVQALMRRRARSAMVAAREEAERANRAKSDFLSSMSHELRTPMNAILGFGQLVAAEQLPAEQADNVQEILRAGHHLLQLINEVLDLAKVESGSIEMSMEPIAVRPLVTESLALVAPLAEQRGIRLRHDCNPRDAVIADRVRLKQALINLLSNAIKYNRSGGDVDVTLEPAPSLDAVRITVRDTGAGIAEESLSELFVPFSRLGAEKTDVEGTGIGLAFTQRIVEQMGGQVGVRSQPGEGSSFWIELPTAGVAVAAPATQSPDQHTPDGTAGAEATVTVLYIEDNPANIKLVQQVMKRRPQASLQVAHTPELGIELARSWRPDLIFLDINMPGMDGYQVLRVLHDAYPPVRAPIVAVTANAMPRDIQRGMAAGFFDYLTKPIDIAALLRFVDAASASAGRRPS